MDWSGLGSGKAIGVEVAVAILIVRVQRSEWNPRDVVECPKFLNFESRSSDELRGYVERDPEVWMILSLLSLYAFMTCHVQLYGRTRGSKEVDQVLYAS